MTSDVSAKNSTSRELKRLVDTSQCTLCHVDLSMLRSVVGD